MNFNVLIIYTEVKDINLRVGIQYFTLIVDLFPAFKRSSTISGDLGFTILFYLPALKGMNNYRFILNSF